MKRLTTFLIILIATLFLSACDDKDNLPPPHALVDFTPTLKVKQLWLEQPDKWATGTEQGSGVQYVFLRPVIAKNTIYTVDYRGYLTANDKQSGDLLWQKQLKMKVTSGIIYAQGKLLLGTEDGDVVALNAVDGKVLWQHSLGNTIISPVNARDNIVLAKDIEGKVFCLSLATGKQHWVYDNGAPSLILRGGSQPQFAGNKAIVGFADGNLLALSLSQGKLLWKTTIALPTGVTPLQQMVDIDVAPVVHGNSIYVATYQGQIVALSAATGQVRWNRDFSAYTGMVMGQRYLFVSDAKSDVWAFNPGSGQVEWRQRNLSWRFITAPVIMNNTVVVADAEGYIHWLRQANGKFAGRTVLKDNFDKPTGIYAAPLVTGNQLFAFSKKGWLGAYQVVGISQ